MLYPMPMYLPANNLGTGTYRTYALGTYLSVAIGNKVPPTVGRYLLRVICFLVIFIFMRLTLSQYFSKYAGLAAHFS